jgi:Amt family ammonium transporter
VVVASGEWLERGLKLDDVVGAVPVHGFCGLWGVLAAGIFAKPEFLLYPDNRFYQVGIQALGSGVCFLLLFGGGWVFFKVLDRLMGMRVSPEAERQGLNLSEHQAISSVQQLATTMREIAQQKDWVRRVELDPYEDVGELGEHFNRLLDVVETTLRSLRENRQLLASSYEELAVKVKELELLNHVMMGREERILELKEELKALKGQSESQST